MIPCLDAIFARCEDYGECRLWTGSLNGSSKHPKIYIEGHYRAARRVVYELARGPVPAGRCVSLSCRESLCLEPKHMLTRSPREVQLRAQRMDASRVSIMTAAARTRRSNKLSMELAREIRSSGEPAIKAAKRLGVNKSLIWRIRRNEAWSEVTRGASVFSM